MKKDGKIEAKVRRSVYLDGQCRRFLKGQVCSDLYIYRSLFLRTVHPYLNTYLVFIDLLIFGTCSRSMRTPTPTAFSPSVCGSAVRRIAMLQHVLASSAASGLATAAHLSFSGGFNGKRVPLPQCKYILRRI